MALNVFAYLDDIIICTDTFDKHIQVLQQVLNRLNKAKLRPNPEKCQFFRSKLKYLGHVVNEEGLHTDPDKVAVIKNLTPPRNLKEARRWSTGVPVATLRGHGTPAPGAPDRLTLGNIPAPDRPITDWPVPSFRD